MLRAICRPIGVWPGAPMPWCVRHPNLPVEMNTHRAGAVVLQPDSWSMCMAQPDCDAPPGRRRSSRDLLIGPRAQNPSAAPTLQPHGLPPLKEMKPPATRTPRRATARAQKHHKTITIKKTIPGNGFPNSDAIPAPATGGGSWALMSGMAKGRCRRQVLADVDPPSTGAEVGAAHGPIGIAARPTLLTLGGGIA